MKIYMLIGEDRKEGQKVIIKIKYDKLHAIELWVIVNLLVCWKQALEQ